jgi:hypothetical protein
MDEFALITIRPLLHTHLSPPPDMCSSSDQAAYYHILSFFKFGASSVSDPALAAGKTTGVGFSVGAEIYFPLH